MLFLDNFVIKELKTMYNSKEALLRIWQYIFEHIKNLDTTLEYIEHTDACIRPKSQFLKKELDIVEFVTDTDRQYSAVAKVLKILE